VYQNVEQLPDFGLELERLRTLHSLAILSHSSILDIFSSGIDP
jgi:hypothetical protein